MTNNPSNELERGSYEIIRNRLHKQSQELQNRLDKLNNLRKKVFGNVEFKLVSNDRINTSNYCIARDIAAFGNYCLFGYNVQIGLRSETTLRDVFSLYQYKDQRFQEQELTLLNDDKFKADFKNLYRYYRNAFFTKFVKQGPFLYMVFQLSDKVGDYKSFKWLQKEEHLEYVDGRSEHELKRPDQYEFQWTRAHREMYRNGEHPHISILDRVFVETVGGDLTIKIEDNTSDGLGIYREDVEHAEQTLDDAEYFFADLGNMIALKIKPYQEAFRYFIFNDKTQQVQRIDALGESGILLPDRQGLVFPNGYYLQSGDYKIFNPDLKKKHFEKRIVSSNGEDFLYVFFNDEKGTYVILPYNIIEQKANIPIYCNGFTLFPNGELAIFRSENEPTKHHVIQIWQTPFLKGEPAPSQHSDEFIFKIGNKEVVKAMAEINDVLILCRKEDSYANLYDDILKESTDILDSFHWLNQESTFRIDEPVTAIKDIAATAIEAFEKKVDAERATKQEVEKVNQSSQTLFDKIKRANFESVEEYVNTLTQLRQLRGEIISLKDLRYVDAEFVDTLEKQTKTFLAKLSEECVGFLLQDDALSPYESKIKEHDVRIKEITTVKIANDLEEDINSTGAALELLIDVVSNLKIEDTTQTTRIIDNISALYVQLNQLKASVKKEAKALATKEASAAFGAQLKLIDQALVNYLDLAVSPEKCDTYLTKLMVQIEELEGKFIELDDFIEEIGEKRTHIFSAFDQKKARLLEERNNRTAAIERAIDRMSESIQNRANALSDKNEINAFFSSDLMVDKVRDLISQLRELQDSNKADAAQTQLKRLKEEALRQLRDKTELYLEGGSLIRFGKHTFSVNIQPLELTMVNREDALLLHLTGTSFFMPLEEPELIDTQSVWKQALPSENETVYRGEFLAYSIFKNKNGLGNNTNWEAFVKEEAQSRYQEGYVKGVHDQDAENILKALLELDRSVGLLRFAPDVRALARYFWELQIDVENRALFQEQLKSAGMIRRFFPTTHEFDYLIEDIEGVLRAESRDQLIRAFNNTNDKLSKVAQYLFYQLSDGESFVISPEAAGLYDNFKKYLNIQKGDSIYQNSIAELEKHPLEQFQLIKKWMMAFLHQQSLTDAIPFLNETSILLLLEPENYSKKAVLNAKTTLKLENLHGDHPVIVNNEYKLDFLDFTEKMEHFHNERLPLFNRFQEAKRGVLHKYRQKLQLESFKPRVLSSFVRNKLIDKVYLPIIGDNLAKQIGVAGENTRTDRMGLLLLISPPGYGKTSLMEYVANQLGLIFMKINGPAIGHRVTSLDPKEAPNRAAAQELNKLNLALEMGDNIMLYLDDIQHCHAEFLQKFISLCDAQRKIEGVFKGESKQYDLRGKRVCVVMAGNPYTESGEKFKVPDMLANRADIYNLGDIIGDTEHLFKLSYIENALTSNSTLQQLVNKSNEDMHQLIEVAATGNQESLQLEADYGTGEVEDYLSVLKKLILIRDALFKVNKNYIQSAAMADDYRSEPAFKLQGSYRDMNKLAEKVVPLMNEKEVSALLLTHYESEAQTLTTGAEANFLKLKEILDLIQADEKKRWEEIKHTFQKNKLFRGGNGDNPVAQAVAQLGMLTDELEGIKKALNSNKEEAGS